MNRPLEIGMLVRHKIKGYIGVFDGTTTIKSLFESPSDTIGYRVQVEFSPHAKRQIASPENLEAISSLPLKERHKANLAFFGISYKGTRRADISSFPRRHRITHCWFCKRALDNAIDIECSACGWIICQCGACGCGHDKIKSSSE